MIPLKEVKLTKKFRMSCDLGGERGHHGAMIKDTGSGHMQTLVSPTPWLLRLTLDKPWKTSSVHLPMGKKGSSLTTRKFKMNERLKG